MARAPDSQSSSVECLATPQRRSGRPRWKRATLRPRTTIESSVPCSSISSCDGVDSNSHRDCHSQKEAEARDLVEIIDAASPPSVVGGAGRVGDVAAARAAANQTSADASSPAPRSSSSLSLSEGSTELDPESLPPEQVEDAERACEHGGRRMEPPFTGNSGCCVQMDGVVIVDGSLPPDHPRQCQHECASIVMEGLVSLPSPTRAVGRSGAFTRRISTATTVSALHSDREADDEAESADGGSGDQACNTPVDLSSSPGDSAPRGEDPTLADTPFEQVRSITIRSMRAAEHPCVSHQLHCVSAPTRREAPATTVLDDEEYSPTLDMNVCLQPTMPPPQQTPPASPRPVGHPPTSCTHAPSTASAKTGTKAEQVSSPPVAATLASAVKMRSSVECRLAAEFPTTATAKNREAVSQTTHSQSAATAQHRDVVEGDALLNLLGGSALVCEAEAARVKTVGVMNKAHSAERANKTPPSTPVVQAGPRTACVSGSWAVDAPEDLSGDPCRVTAAVAPVEEDPAWFLGRVDAPLERLMFGESPSQAFEMTNANMLEELLESPSVPEQRRVEAMRSARAGLRGGANSGGGLWRPDAPGLDKRVAEHRMGAWFHEHSRGEHSRGEPAQPTFVRAPDEHEETFDSAILTALASSRQLRVSRIADGKERPRVARGDHIGRSGDVPRWSNASSSAVDKRPSRAVPAPPPSGAPQAAVAAVEAASEGLLAAFRAALGENILVDGLRCVPFSGNFAKVLPPELIPPNIVALRLPPRLGMLTGECITRATASVEELLKKLGGVAIFKIGITCNPPMRWQAYQREGYEQFHLLYCDEHPRPVEMMEAALIDKFVSRSGCRNVARGGEGPTGRGPYFTYLALARCDSGIVSAPRRKRARVLCTNGDVWTVASHAFDSSSSKLMVKMQKSSFKYVLYTHYSEPGHQLPFADRAGAAGLMALTETSDGFFVYGKRSEKVAAMPGHWHCVPAGNVDSSDFKVVLEKELREEVGASFNDADKVQFFAFMDDGAEQGHKYEFVFHVRLKLAAFEVHDLHSKAEDKYEHAELKFVRAPWNVEPAAAPSDVPVIELEDFVRNYPLTDVSRRALLLAQKLFGFGQAPQVLPTGQYNSCLLL